jgi:hypothetical protein
MGISVPAMYSKTALLVTIDTIESIRVIRVRVVFRLTNYTVGVLVSRHRPKLIVNAEFYSATRCGALL